MGFSPGRKLLHVLILFVTNPVGASPMDLDEVFSNAVTNHDGIKLQQASREAADARVSAGFGQVLPRITAFGAYTRQAQPNGLSNAATDPNQWSARISLTQPLFRGLSDIYGWKALKARSRAEAAAVTRERFELYTDVARVFYGVHEAARALATAEQLFKVAETRLSEVRGRVRIGRSRQGELFSLESQTASLLSAKLAAESAFQVALAEFAAVTHITGKPALREPQETLEPISGELSVHLAKLETRSDLIALKEELNASDEAVAAAKGGHLPTIELNANYYLHRTGFLRDVRWDFGVTASLPLFEGGTRVAAVREAVALRHASEAQLALTRRDAARSLRVLYEQYQSAIHQWAALKAASEGAKKNYDQQAKDYRFGLVSNLDVLQAMNQWQEAKRSADQLFFRAKQWHAQWDSALGQVKVANESF